MDSVKGEIISQATQFEEIKSHKNIAKPGVVFTPIKLPDLNNSTSIFQQAFTENQQLQLRAQILVYGSLISRSPPEESHMIAAFVQSDGRGLWRACLESLHAQKSRPKADIPEQPQSGNKDDQRNVRPYTQNEVTSSPIATISNKGAPPTITPMIPLSSSNNLQSSGVPKIARPDYHQPLPLNLYQNPPIPNISALNPSWLSQGPFAGQWVTPGVNPTPHFPPLHVTEPVKVTQTKESGGSGSNLTSNLTVQNSALASSPEHFSNSKSRKRKKATPSLLSTPQNVEKVVMSEETLTKVKESKTQAEEANKHVANAESQCHEVWSQLKSQCNYDPDEAAKLVSSAVSIAAAAKIAKVAAAAAKIVSDIANQAKSMVNVSLINKSQNLVHPEAIRKAAEMAAEVVVQAGKIVALNEPMSLKYLVEAGPECYWKTPRLSSKQQSILAAGNLNCTKKKNVDFTTEVNDKRNPVTELSSSGKDKGKPRVREGHEMSNSIGAVRQTKPKVSSDTMNECNIKEGCLVEVFKDDDKHNGAWFGAKVLDLKDGKALVSYTEIRSDNEWVPLEVHGTEVPKIRMAHPMTTMLFEGTRKRRRTSSTDFAWSTGDRVDVWIQDRGVREWAWRQTRLMLHL
ncbi:protein SWOLLEN 1-like isoform X2 [Rutidosis leptorrhynchoides]|uniref:protein SWOLLEN 1-like isoform X2 n=1 Tax=Rutidosis leptorrhynchoides TaxID=125765 RepID=UPI003A999E5D